MAEKHIKPDIEAGSESHLSVVHINYEEFQKRLRELKETGNYEAVYTNDWKVADLETPITNDTAMNCVVFYVVNRTSGQILSGHFMETDSSKIKDRFEGLFPEYDFSQTDMRNAFLNFVDYYKKTHSRPLDRLHPINGYIKYTEMLDRISDWIDESEDSNNIDLYMFGQNREAEGMAGSEQFETSLSSAKSNHNRTLGQLAQAGIPFSQIKDLRVPGVSKRDDTLYDPTSKTIYHCSRLESGD